MAHEHSPKQDQNRVMTDTSQPSFRPLKDHTYSLDQRPVMLRHIRTMTDHDAYVTRPYARPYVLPIRTKSPRSRGDSRPVSRNMTGKING